MDEINLASSESLSRLCGILDDRHSSITLIEKNDTKLITRHPNFRLFANMNPPTDYGKKELAPWIRNRFTEFFVSELNDTKDLSLIVKSYIDQISSSMDMNIIQGIVKFYQTVKCKSNELFLTANDKKPHFNLRCLIRALEYILYNNQNKILKYNSNRAIYEGFCMMFVTPLTLKSRLLMKRYIKYYLFGIAIADESELDMQHKQILVDLEKCPRISHNLSEEYIIAENFVLKLGRNARDADASFIITPTIQVYIYCVFFYFHSYVL